MEIFTPTHSDQVPSALNDPRGNLLRPAQLSEHVQDIKTCQAQLDNPNVQDKGAVRQRLSSLTRQYDAQAPRVITDGAVKDKLVAESERLLEQILPGMLSKEEMRKNPAGSVDRHMRWERANKAKIIRWKKLQCALNADTSDPHTWDRDAANLEQFRPQGPSDKFRADAQITGKMSYGSVPGKNWEEAFGSVHPETSALNQAKRAADARVDLTLPPRGTGTLPQARTIVEPVRTRTPMSAERREQCKNNLARGREAKKQQRLANQL